MTCTNHFYLLQRTPCWCLLVIWLNRAFPTSPSKSTSLQSEIFTSQWVCMTNSQSNWSWGLKWSWRALKKKKWGPLHRLIIFQSQLLRLWKVSRQFNAAHYDNVLLWAACCLAFFGFLRCEEFTVPSQTEYDPDTQLFFGAVELVFTVVCCYGGWPIRFLYLLQLYSKAIWLVSWRSHISLIDLLRGLISS